MYTTSHQSSRMWLPFSVSCKLRAISVIHKSNSLSSQSMIYFKTYNIRTHYHIYQNVPLLISRNSIKNSLHSRDFKNSGPTL